MRRIKDWPADERPWEKLLVQGEPALTYAELLAMIIRTGDATSKASAVELDRALLSRFGSPRELAQAGIAELCQEQGGGHSTFVRDCPTLC